MALLGSVLTPTAFAQTTHYTDVPSGSYYEEAAFELLRTGALDSNEARLRPNDLATRAEVMKLLVNVNGTDLVTPATPSFNDVPKSAWYYSYMETAAREGWVKGDGNCYGSAPSRCAARPADQVNRAEMAIILQRAFRLPHLELAPLFPDNTNRGNWYFAPIQTAADHCILQGDDSTGRVRPAASMNRAEMVVMFHRASQQMRYGQDCAVPTAHIMDVTTPASNRVRVTFNVDLDANTISQTSRYTVEEISGIEAGAVIDVDVINARTAELSLAGSLQSGKSYRLEVSNMRTEGGAVFDDVQTFTSDEGEEASISTVTAQSENVIRVRFSADVDSSRMQEEARYLVERVSNGADISIDSAVRVDDRTVDLTLDADLSSGTSYHLTVNDMRTEDGTNFDDDMTFNSLATSQHISSVVATSANNIRLTFDTDLQENDAEDRSNYSVTRTDGVGSISVQNANAVSSRIVDLTLNANLVANISYEVETDGLRTTSGETFDDSVTFTFTAVAGHVTGVTAVANNKLRVSFDTDLDPLRAEQAVRYNVTNGSSTFPVQTADLLSDERTVELTLVGTMASQTSYTVNVIDMRTDTGVTFSGSGSVIYDGGSAQIGATLTGGQESPPVGTAASGTGTFTLTSTGLQYDITVKNLSSTLTAAHFHRGIVGVSGSAVHEISFSGNRATGTWTNISAELRNAIMNEEIYVNVHTSNHPDGEIRGQLLVP
jgi:hypothetical protein